MPWPTHGLSVSSSIAFHRGHIVKTTGDGMLVRFASAVDAVRNAVEIQRSMAEQNSAVRPDQRIEFRIGIHVGDIIFDDNDIFGDGVNIAARLEGIAEPGGVRMSDDAYRQIRGKVEIACDDMGPQSLKNIAEPVRTWRVRLTGQILSAVRSDSDVSQPPALPLPDKPSIAVLPFRNMSDDPEQEYFADGMVEDIITALSKRPVSILCLEDKIVQQAVATVLEAIYEEDFLGFSYGFRPGRASTTRWTPSMPAFSGSK
jgi:Adenylate and Guanylate cyclase catalytic domain